MVTPGGAGRAPNGNHPRRHPHSRLCRGSLRHRRGAPEITTEFEALSPHADPGIRQSLVIAAGYFPAPGLVRLVQVLGDTDPIDHVRTNAALLVAGLSNPAG